MHVLKGLCRLKVALYSYSSSNIHNFFGDFQDIDIRFTWKKLQKQLA